ncbi:DUF3618 domain-containing protein [Actinoplanes subtropicus]|uniref:DUF3618 domain-containing protein n=1 Tax=Actinoplanes subtropicus TaxID=543632 RepID=UPI0004C331FE|nr:DUF3618 domain-containing protein [Actinoplanes subtropicus]
MSIEPELRAEIERTRAELGETVEALAAKADLRARLQDSVADVRARLRDSATDVWTRLRDSAAVRRAAPPAVAAVALATGIVLVVRGRRR